jgi:hypothetical protein
VSEKETPSILPPSADDLKWLTCDGQQLKKMAKAGLEVLELNRQAVNDLNVFPVPDGDTGTNMVLTMRAAIKQLEGFEGDHVGEAARELAQGALMGARGNSGVILSQIWRGFARTLKDTKQFGAEELAEAIKEGSDTAYKGVMRPVEGTILTVIREGAEEALDATSKSWDLRFILARMVERCQQSLERTPELLPVLKQAGVVDAGGQGLVYILEGMLGYVTGELKLKTAETTAAELAPQALVAPAGGLDNPYDVQFILHGENLDVISIRNDIDAMGDSTVVVGDERTIKVHVHVKDPGVPISYGIGRGRIDDVVVENMQAQMDLLVRSQPPQQASAAIDIPEVEVKEGEIAIVAVAAGDGLADIFRSLGANGIVDGGQSNNPSTEEIYKAIEKMPTDKVIVLPNNKNIILAAEAAKELSSKEVYVVPTKNVPQAVSAMLCLNRAVDVGTAAASMNEACSHVSSGEIAFATRSANLHGVTVEEGEIIGVANGRLCASSSEVSEVLQCILEEMDMKNRELISVYYGSEVSEDDAESLAEEIVSLYPEAEVEVLRGGQSIYQYILGAE